MVEGKLVEMEARPEAAAALGRAAAIMARLRAPGGCPWDREQTFDSIKRYTLEETYEVFDAIERSDWAGLKDELGDLLLQVLFYAEMAEEAGYFTLKDVAENLSAKLIRRHPHVFGEVNAEDSDAVLRNWEQIKQQEKQARGGAEPASMLADVPRTMPAVMEAQKIGSKAAKVGFDWPDASGLFAKVDEEIAELMIEVEANHRENVEEEFGDLMFTIVNLARHLKVDPEGALRAANAKFRERFAAMEQAAGGRERMEAMSAEQLEALWERAKDTERLRTKTEVPAEEKN
jgi:XTP/dITP diphosphohydrolase/ATP diphosphatase